MISLIISEIFNKVSLPNFVGSFVDYSKKKKKKK